ncbi:fibril-forming collagen alpha chain-like [Haliotis rufescens]|uniref:fibril-forming collagen alpha chain-like n=1 Tax=Haliotis rufescens TaxID=6454 RepID=UPI00201F4C78|nr:fibril-forming collagen alpha chain-like [Haliotis rufescens]
MVRGVLETHFLRNPYGARWSERNWGPVPPSESPWGEMVRGELETRSSFGIPMGRDGQRGTGDLFLLRNPHVARWSEGNWRPVPPSESLWGEMVRGELETCSSFGIPMGRDGQRGTADYSSFGIPTGRHGQRGTGDPFLLRNPHRATWSEGYWRPVPPSESPQGDMVRGVLETRSSFGIPIGRDGQRGTGDPFPSESLWGEMVREELGTRSSFGIPMGRDGQRGTGDPFLLRNPYGARWSEGNWRPVPPSESPWGEMVRGVLETRSSFGIPIGRNGQRGTGDLFLLRIPLGRDGQRGTGDLFLLRIPTGRDGQRGTGDLFLLSESPLGEMVRGELETCSSFGIPMGRDGQRGTGDLFLPRQ